MMFSFITTYVVMVNGHREGQRLTEINALHSELVENLCSDMRLNGNTNG